MDTCIRTLTYIYVCSHAPYLYTHVVIVYAVTHALEQLDNLSATVDLPRTMVSKYCTFKVPATEIGCFFPWIHRAQREDQANNHHGHGLITLACILKENEQLIPTLFHPVGPTEDPGIMASSNWGGS